MKLKDSMLLNSGVKKDKNYLLTESVKTKELALMSSAINNVSSFLNSVEYALKDLNCKKDKLHGVGAMPNPAYMGPYSDLSAEEKKVLKEKLKSFYMSKMDFIKESLEDLFKEEESEEEEEEKEEKEEDNLPKITVGF